MKDNNPASRREFLKLAALTGVGVGLAGTSEQAIAEEGPTKLLPKVPRKQLGTTGADIPILLQGCAMKFDPKYDKLLHRGFKEGVNYLDTAIVYAHGQSHATLRPFIEQVGRKNLWITSKGPSDDATPEVFAQGLIQAISELGVDHLDLYFMHYINDVKFLEPEYIRLGERLRKSGKTRFFGFSCHGKHVVALLNKAARVGGIDAIMFRYDFSKYGDTALNKAIDACKKAGIGLIAMKTQRSVPSKHEKVVQFKSKQFNLAQAKLKAVWADERIDAAVSHMDNTTKLAENVFAAKSPTELTMNEFLQLQQLARATAAYHCAGCGQTCEPLLGGQVQVADTLRYLMYHECYGETEQARELYRRLRPDQRWASSAALARATAACPQGIDLARRLAEAEQLLG